MSETRSGGPRINGDQLRDLNRLRRPKDERMIAGVAAGVARQLDIDPTIVRVVLGALVIFGGAGILLYTIAWLTIPDEGQENSAASDLLRRDPQVVMFVGLILAAAVAGMTMMGTLVWSSPNPWPIMVVAVLAALGLVLFTRRPESSAQLPPPAPSATGVDPSGPSTDSATGASSGGDAADASSTGDAADPSSTGEAADASSTDAAAGVSSADAAPGLPAYSTAVHEAPPGGPDLPPVPQPPTPPPPPPLRRPRSRLLAITLCVVLLAEGAIWLVDNAADVDVHPSVYPGTALGIVAVALLVGAWYGRSRLLILAGVLASIATLAASVIGEGPHGERAYTPRSAAAVPDRYHHGAGDLEVHLEEVDDIEALAGRTIEVDANVGQVTVYVPGSVDATIFAEVTGGGDVDGLPHVEESGHGQVEATQTPVDDADPDITIDVSLRFGQIDIRQVPCAAISDSRGVIDVPAACN